MTKVKIIRLIEPKVKEVKINDKEKEASLEEMTNDESPETKAWLSTDTERPTTLIRVDRERQVAAPREQAQTPVANNQARSKEFSAYETQIRQDELKKEYASARASQISPMLLRDERTLTSSPQQNVLSGNERQRERFPIQDDGKKYEAERGVAEVRTKRKMPWDI
ncbi:hypothetical protein J4461_04585 [Candidatus Pacearchaeota archaeon]|nr:hypothetical protein [Candidatus Pacearchaeota archaeon]